MTEEEAERFLGELQASMGKTISPKEVKQAWLRWAVHVDFDLALQTLQKLERLVGPNGFDKYSRVNLSNMRQAYETEKLSREQDASQWIEIDLPDCSLCGKSGLVYVVKGGEDWKSAMVRTRDSLIPWPVLVVCIVPCNCFAGDRLARHYGLSKKAREWIARNASFRYPIDAQQQVRACHGLPPVNYKSGIANEFERIIATPRQVIKQPVGRERNRETEKQHQAENWAY